MTASVIALGARRGPFGGATSTIGLSVALHVALALAAAHGRSSAIEAPQEPTEIVLEDEPEAPPPPDPPEETPQADRAADPPPAQAAPAPSPRAVAPPVHAIAVTERQADDPSPPADAPAAMTSDDALPHFTLATSTAGGATGGTLAKSAGTGVAAASDPEDTAYGEGSVDVPAHAVRRAKPNYPFEAQSGGVEGAVKLEIVLSKTGAIESVRALNHPGHGFEQEAIVAARKTLFSPAMKHGQPVRVRMAWTVEFQLQ